MVKVKNLGRPFLALALVLALLMCMCADSLAVFATEKASSESRKDAIIKELFGEDISPEEAFDIVLEESKKMNDYVNGSFCYVPNNKSYYVAFGDETAAITTRQTSTYVDKLASALGVSYKNLSKAQMTIQDVYAAITDNSQLVKKADLISIGFSNYGATYFMCKYMAGKADMVTEKDWVELVGEENMPLVEELLDSMFKELGDRSMEDFGGYDLAGALECYAYAYLSNAIHQAEVIEAIREINADAVILLVGTYNDLENVKLDVEGEMMDLGGMMVDLVNAANLLATKNADAYRRVAYVHAPDVTTTLDANASKYTTPRDYVLAITGRQGLPTADGQAYIKNQIKNAISSTCSHTWDDGTVTKEPTCNQQGVMSYVCTWCNQTKTEQIDATNQHNYESVVTNPTCTEEGYTTHTCTVCGDSYKSDFTEMVDHSWGDGVVTKQPTSEAEGEMTYTCDHCGKTKTEAIEKTEPSEVKPGDANGDGKVSASDARAILRYIAGLIDESEFDRTAADYNQDGKVTATDARAILRFIAGIG